jgi:hypothetical protein
MDPKGEQRPHPSIPEPRSLAEAKKYKGSVIWCGPRVWNAAYSSFSTFLLLHEHCTPRSRPMANTARQQQQGVLALVGFVASIPAQTVAPNYILGDTKTSMLCCQPWQGSRQLNTVLYSMQ